MGKFRFLLVHELIEQGLKAEELRGNDATYLTPIVCCLTDQHINLQVDMPRPQKRLTRELGNERINVFLQGVGTGKRTGLDLSQFPAS